VFCAAVTTIVPGPLPLAPLVIVRNGELLVAVHEQLETVESAIETGPPPLLALAFVVETEMAHAGATSWNADCVKFTLVPLTAMLAERSAPVLAAMLYPTDPLPVPVAPDVTVRKLALLTAVHEQVDAAVTGSVPVVADDPTLVVTLPSVTEQELAPEDGAVSLLEHAAAASATPAERAVTSKNRL